MKIWSSDELDESCKSRIEKARFEERSNSITRIVIVGLFTAGAITNKRIYFWPLLGCGMSHLLRMAVGDRRAGTRDYLIFVWLEILAVVLGDLGLMSSFMWH